MVGTKLQVVSKKRSIFILMKRSNRKFRLKRKLTYGTTQRFLIQKFGKPRRKILRPKLEKSHINSRRNFAEYIIASKIDGRYLFSTGEKRFLLHFNPNKQTNQIRLKKSTKRKIKRGNQKAMELLISPTVKHSTGFMVCWWSL